MAGVTMADHGPAPPAGGRVGRRIVSLRDGEAADPDRTGAKAANLARAAGADLPVLPGIVLTTGAGLDEVTTAELRDAWDGLQATHPGAVVVRSSSTVEDIGSSSMAGQFTSVLDVRSWPALLDAVGVVLASADHPHGGTSAPAPMAVLVQPLLEAVSGGVLFGLDPVTGDDRHVTVDAVPGAPEAVVSGTVTATHCVLSRRGRLLEATGPVDAFLGPSRRRRLAALAGDVARVFGSPQDVEWAFDGDDRLWLLQSRPVTAAADRVAAHGPLLGPGPVAETFPEPLRPLEVDLWVDPLREGVVGALETTGAVPRRRIVASPVVTAVGGRVAVDLELLGVIPRRRAGLRRLSPAPGARRLAAAWRVGRLRAALPALAGDLMEVIDTDLAEVPDLADMDDLELVDLLDGARQDLVALHGHEVLAGVLLDGGGDRSSGAAAALAATARGRRRGLSDEEIVARDPVALALVPPGVGRRAVLPELTAGVPTGAVAPEQLGPREALRLRARWVQELTARVAEELGRRLAARSALSDAAAVRELSLDELKEVAAGGGAPAGLDARAATPSGPPLPTAFRLSRTARPVAVADQGGAAPEGIPAGGGRAEGLVRQAPGAPADERPVLVVDVLDPRLAAELPRLAGLVAETGSPLSHLAILARETGVPVVVGVADARRRFPEGTRVLVDGGTGEVRALDGGAGR